MEKQNITTTETVNGERMDKRSLGKNRQKAFPHSFEKQKQNPIHNSLRRA